MSTRRKVISMARLDKLWIIVTTASERPAITRPGFPTIPGDGAEGGTDSGFNLWLYNHRYRFEDLPYDEREPGQNDIYEFDVSDAAVDMDNVRGSRIAMEILGSDAWLPASIWAIGEDVNRSPKLLVHIPRWPRDQYWSTDPREGLARRPLVLPA